MAAEDWQQSHPSGQEATLAATPAAAAPALELPGSSAFCQQAGACPRLPLCRDGDPRAAPAQEAYPACLGGHRAGLQFPFDVSSPIDGPVLSKLITAFYRSIPSRIKWVLPVGLLCCPRRDAEVSTAVCVECLGCSLCAEKVVAHHDWEGLFVHLFLFP